MSNHDHIETRDENGELKHENESDWNPRSIGREEPAESIRTDKILNVADHILTSTDDLESTFGNLSDGDTVYIATPSTPYRTTQWLDIDASGVEVVFQSAYAEDGSRVIKVADGANVGGFRVGYNSAISDITIRNFGYHGNEANQDSTVKRLHALKSDQVSDLNIIGGDISRTSPYHEHGSGGSGLSFEDGGQYVTVRGVRFFEIGDRAIQTTADDTLVEDCRSEQGYDRFVACNVQTNDSTTNSPPEGVIVRDCTLRTNSNGSFVGVGNGNGTVKHVKVIDNMVFGGHRTVTRVREGQHVLIKGNTGIIDTSKVSGAVAGVDIDPNSTASDVQVVNNYLDGYPNDGIRLGRPDCVARDNEIRNVGETNNVAGYGIRIVDSAEARDNDIRLSRGDNIFLKGSGARAIDNTVSKGNQVGGSFFSEIRIAASSCTVKGNEVLVRNGTYSLKDDTGDGNIIQDNIIPDDGSQYNLTAATSGGADPVIEQNTPRYISDVRNFAPTKGTEMYHDGSGSNTQGPAVYRGAAWYSLVDGTTIS